MTESIFQRYFKIPDKLDDRFENSEEGVDVIIPVINTNELWERNLHSFYREVPIRRLIIGDGGCTDDTLEIAKKFPRVEIIEQEEYETQGYCIKELIEDVESEWFIYLHADVFLPDGWYDKMKAKRGEYDWFECYRKKTALIEWMEHSQNNAERAFSGSQMGRKKAFDTFLDEIEDDYLQRNEDIVLAELIEKNGFNYGRISDTFHYHQVMEREGAESSFGEKEPEFTNVSIEKEDREEWEVKVAEKQVKGIIKYTSPSPYLKRAVEGSIRRLMESNKLNEKQFKDWVKETDEKWTDEISLKKIKMKIKARAAGEELYSNLRGII